MFVVQSLFLSVETIIPLYVEGTRKDLGTIHAALIMTFTEIAGFIVSPFASMIAERFGRKNSLMIGYVLLVSAVASLAFTYYIGNDYLYFIAAVVCRFICGSGDQMV
jgi:MFS family permease